MSPCGWSPVLPAAVMRGQLQPGRCQLFTPRKQRPSLPECLSFVGEKKMKLVCVAFWRNKIERNRTDDREGACE